MVATASSSMLEVHGRDRDMVRLTGESTEGFRRRLEMKAIISEKAGSREGILLAMSALGYNRSELVPMFGEDPERWAEFIIYLDGDDTSISDLNILYEELLLVKQISSKLAYFVYTNNKPFHNTLYLGLVPTSYTEQTVNRADEIVLVQDRRFEKNLYIAPVYSSYSEEVLNNPDDLILNPDREFEAGLSLSPVPSSYKEELLL